MLEFYMIFARKINKIPEFYFIFAQKYFTRFLGGRRQVPHEPRFLRYGFSK